MKILLFTDEYSNPKLPPSGGVGTFLKILAEELSKRGHKVYVYGFLKKNIEFKENDIVFKFEKKFFKKYKFLEIIRSIANSLKLDSLEYWILKKERKYYKEKIVSFSSKNNIQVIESHVFNGYTALWENNLPLVLRFHGSRGFWHKYLGKKEEKIKVDFEKKSLQSSSKIIAVSNFSSNAIREIYNFNGEIEVVYNGIDVNLFKRKNADKIPQSIFYFGTLSEAKGVDKLCLVFNDLNIKYPDSTLHLIGRGKDYYEGTLKNILTNESLKKTIYYGPIELENLPDLISQATCCVFMSLNETFGLVTIESMSLGIPTISINNLVANEIIDHNVNGFVCNNNLEVVNCILTLFENEDIHNEISYNSRKKIVENFSKDIMIDKTINIYEQLIENHL